MTTCAVDVLLEFFEVCLHSILFSRKVYPASIFALKRKYNLPVYISLNPDLNQYISEVLKSIRKLLISNQLKQISYWILNSSLEPVEKFVFNNFSSSFFGNESKTFNLLELEESFRSFCLRLSISDHIIKPPSDNFSFKIYVETADSTFMNMCEDSSFEGIPWIAEERKSSNELREIFPLQTLHTSSFHFEMFIEK